MIKSKQTLTYEYNPSHLKTYINFICECNHHAYGNSNQNMLGSKSLPKPTALVQTGGFGYSESGTHLQP